MSEDTAWSGTVTATVDDIANESGPSLRLATITIDHGERNLLNPGVMTALRAALLAADADESVAGIVLTGARSVFCGGLDVPAIQAGADPRVFARALVSVLEVFPQLVTPITAAVNGDAVAGGAALVAAADWAAAVPDTRIGTYEVSIGVWPMIAQVPIIHRIGARRAMENIGAGEPFSSERAREVGLIQRVDPDPVAACTTWLVKAARACAVAGHRRSVYQLAELGYDDALAEALTRFVAQFDN